MSAFQGQAMAKKSYLAAIEAMEASRKVGSMDDADLRLQSIPAEMGIPRTVLVLAEALAEGLSSLERLSWTRRFLEAVSPGAGLDKIWMQWTLWSLRDPRCGLLAMNIDTLAHPTLEMLERFYMRLMTGHQLSPDDAARMESIVLLMEEDAANWNKAHQIDFNESGVAAAARQIWEARDGSASKLSDAAAAVARCRQAPNFSKWRCDALIDLVSHAPVAATF